ncbi:alpha/beta fold hydrolase [Hoyosella subflava]|uniref:Alpha/beta hydrolase fold protein n=1 Tax=Hoyosella subflava (strain DSM 45089 / JCM 17490 / NBRC 109087 / DQS3-9A1) TaxID=443218 RepID=F6EP35_HOYSD|nr:alpha/beta hydrolase [Hoyosella subflava]AEF40501.1 Alpha/beta hydrolase fold protein [Hoyosella subflava DQS3-9A1]
MEFAQINAVRIAYHTAGNGAVPLVFVHGSWASHTNWETVIPRFAESFRVVSYDRRGHSDSERPPGQGSIAEDAEDLAALISYLDIVPAWVVANSFGSCIALRLAVANPHLLRGVVVHEPPLMGLLSEVDDPDTRTVLERARSSTMNVAARIESGDHAGAAEYFVENVALGPGSWTQLPQVIRDVFVTNAPTFLDEIRDPDALNADLDGLRTFARPVLLTEGSESPKMFGLIVSQLADVLPNVTTMLYLGAGHVPHLTHPDDYVATVTTFIQQHESRA